MISNKTKKFLKMSALGIGLIIFAASCTANFCSETDKAHLLYKLEGVSVIGENTYNRTLTQIISTAQEKHGYTIPTITFWKEMDKKNAEEAQRLYIAQHQSEEGFVLEDVTVEIALKEFGFAKFANTIAPTAERPTTELWGNWNLWVNEIRIDEEFGPAVAPDRDFQTFYQKEMMRLIQNSRACIAIEEGIYGPVGEKIPVEEKSWSYAWKKGLIEGLLVYPVAWLIEQFTNLFGANGYGQLFAILVVTILVRGLMILFTFRSTLSQQKMQALQPEVQKLQQKYPNSDTNQYEKQQLAQAQMALYKKHGVKPLSQLLVIFIQFPIFIAVWGAMTGSASLASDAIWGLNLNAALGQTISANFFSASWWTATVLFLLMGVSQFISMQLPQWIQKSRSKQVQKLVVNPSAKKQANQGKIMMWVMFVFIIIMSWSLPAAMGIYWLIGALISIVQTSITQYIMGKKERQKR
ncbi:MAG: YidC/Oxa1 family membrane protein insertase [Bacilli bacterium]|jgi:YidC/Oxa1 family membrane protein insertase